MTAFVTSSHSRQPTSEGPVFGSVICGVDGTPAALEAAKQAATLAGHGTSLELVAVTPAAGYPMFVPLPDAGRVALAVARRAAQALGRDASVSELVSSSRTGGLLQAARSHDLLVVGCDRIAGPLGDLPGPVTRAAVELAPQCVLVARELHGGRVVDSILVAVDGSAPAHRAAALAARIAAQHGSDIALVAAPERDAAHVRGLAEDAAVVAAATGSEPVLLDEQGPAAPAIVAAGASIGASLIVLGSRGGDARRPRVSTRVAESARCSVLIVRGHG